MLSFWSRNILLKGKLYDKEQYVDCKHTWRRFHQLVYTAVRPQATSSVEWQHVTCATPDKTMTRAYDPYLVSATEKFRSSSLTKDWDEIGQVRKVGQLILHARNHRWKQPNTNWIQIPWTWKDSFIQCEINAELLWWLSRTFDQSREFAEMYKVFEEESNNDSVSESHTISQK
jgi:hypothetical protein